MATCFHLENKQAAKKLKLILAREELVPDFSVRHKYHGRDHITCLHSLEACDVYTKRIMTRCNGCKTVNDARILFYPNERTTTTTTNKERQQQLMNCHIHSKNTYILGMLPLQFHRLSFDHPENTENNSNAQFRSGPQWLLSSSVVMVRIIYLIRDVCQTTQP